MKKVIAIFGGRFDPIHNGHIHLARAVLRAKQADEIWIVPDNQHQWNPIIASPEHRTSMIKKVLEKNMEIKTTAIDIGGTTETITVFRKLKSENPDFDFVFICGSDQITNFHKWTHWSEIEKELPFIIVSRAGHPAENLPSNCTILKDPEYIPIEDSATRVRNAIKRGENIEKFVAPEVHQYIEKYKLYE